jgi:hypothetical protein
MLYRRINPHDVTNYECLVYIQGFVFVSIFPPLSTEGALMLRCYCWIILLIFFSSLLRFQQMMGQEVYHAHLVLAELLHWPGLDEHLVDRDGLLLSINIQYSITSQAACVPTYVLTGYCTTSIDK